MPEHNDRGGGEETYLRGLSGDVEDRLLPLRHSAHVVLQAYPPFFLVPRHPVETEKEVRERAKKGSINEHEK